MEAKKKKKRKKKKKKKKGKKKKKKKRKKKKRKNTLDLYRAVYFICLEIHAVMNMVKKLSNLPG